MNRQHKHILVPLDGSELAEIALAAAFDLARLCRAEVTLLQVIPPVEDVIALDRFHDIHLDEQWATRKGLALEYLNAVCQRTGCDGVTVHPVVAMGLAAETIIDYAHEHPIDLIVMATHGRTGLKRWVYGSVAEKVLRGADLPVLLVRAHALLRAA